MNVSQKHAIGLTLLLWLLGGCGTYSDTTATAPTTATTPSDATVASTSTTYTAQSEPYYKYAWHLDATNSALNNAGYTIDENADIHLQAAWSITKGKGIKVAVIDFGFDTEHEDLASAIIDTYNADDDTKDVSYSGTDGTHGSTCAGFIVAPINGKGIVGVAPEAVLIAIKQVSDTDADTIRAFEYAKNQGAKVISCSWGTGQVSQAVETELKSLYDAGITVVFASGNNHQDLDANPGYYDESEVPWVIGVGATDDNNDVTSYSDYGYNIDLLAPGGDSSTGIGVLGIDDMGTTGYDSQLGLVNNNYAFVNGTSFACPIVVGVATLMYSVNPNITTKQVRTILIQTADKIGTDAVYDADGFDTQKYRAYGKVNADNAVAEAMSL